MALSLPPRSSLSRLRERAGVRAGELRRNSTDAESVLWRHLRNRQLEGFKFRRQHPIGPFFADFACIEAGLVIELDGGQHFEPQAQVADQERSRRISAEGFAVMRFDNRQLLQETEAVLHAIRARLLSRHPHPNPLPQAGEGVTSTRSST